MDFPSRLPLSATTWICFSEAGCLLFFFISDAAGDETPTESSSEVLVSECDGVELTSESPYSSDTPSPWPQGSDSGSSSRSECLAVKRTVRISSSRGYRYLTCFLTGKNTRRDALDPPLGLLGAKDMEEYRRLAGASSGELRRMLFSPRGSW